MAVKVVFKYTLKVTDNPVIDIHEGARILTAVGSRAYNEITLWAEVDPEAPKIRRAFRIAGTGHRLGEVGPYICTVMDPPFVWHVYEGVVT